MASFISSSIGVIGRDDGDGELCWNKLATRLVV